MGRHAKYGNGDFKIGMGIADMVSRHQRVLEKHWKREPNMKTGVTSTLLRA